MSDPSTIGAQLHGPGGLLSTSGLGGARRKKWGKRAKSACTCGVTTKAGEPGEHIAPGVTRIRGNLCNVHGKYGPCDAGATAKPTAKPKKGKGRKPKASAKPKKAPVTPEQRAVDHTAAQAQAQTDTLTKMNIAPDGQAALLALRTGKQPDPAAIARGGFEDAGLVERAADGSYRLTASGRAALSAARSGDSGRTGDTISSARDRVGARKQRQQAAADRKAQTAARRATVAARRAKKKAPISGQAAAAPTIPRATPTRKRSSMPKAGPHVAPLKGQMNAAKSFTVYKDHAGRPRWIARTTTAYQDRDNEIISEAALDADSARMTTTKVFGPLRWWHVGTPDPLNDAQPWGAGLDIGDCDYSTLIGRTRVESGTFRNDAIAEKVARAAAHLEMSPGFFHPLDHPRDGVYSTIRTFERSLVPTRYARASNLFTGFTVKECSMEIPEMEKRFKAMYAELGLTPEQGATLGQQLVATEKTAQAQGIAFKEEAQPFAEEITINGVVYKAFPPAKDTVPIVEDVIEEKAPPVEDVAVDLAAPEEMEPEGNYVGDMDADTFFGMLDERLAPIIKLQDMLKTMGDMHSELKGMYGGTVTKEAGNTAEIAALKARIAEIEGRQPATILPDEVAAAMKSAGPSDPDQPAEPGIVNVLNDPTRPWAGWGAATFPELYKTQA